MASVNERTKALLAAYTAKYGTGMKAAIDATLKIVPLFCCCIYGRNKCVRATKEALFNCIISNSDLNESCVNSPPEPIPALLISISTCKLRF